MQTTPQSLRLTIALAGHTRGLRTILAAMPIALAPSLACADALIPTVNAYGNTEAFYFIFALVVLLEALCIRFWLRRPNFAAVLWRVILLNAASSLAGFLLMRTEWRPDFIAVWKQAIPLFFLTLLVEWPLLLLLFRRFLSSWRQALLVATVANVVSYAVLVAAERPVETVWLRLLGAKDGQTLQGWKNPRMLAELQGVIYGTEQGKASTLQYRLRRFSFSDGKWHSMTNCPPIDPIVWDVEGKLLAYKRDYPSTSVAVRTIPDFALVQELTLTNKVNPNGRWELSLSPDGHKLAVLATHHEIHVPLRGTSYMILGNVCELVVFDTTTGATLGTSPRKALSGGLCWLPDADTILFSSLQDEALLDLTMLGKDWRKAFPRPGSPISNHPVYAYQLSAGAVRFFDEMPTPHLAAQSRQILCRKGWDALDVRDIDGGHAHGVQIGGMGYREIVVSPDGRSVIAPFTLRHPLGYFGYPTIVDLANPSRRQFLAGFDYRLDWTTE